MNKPKLIAIMGPTASGKSDVAEKVADVLNAELISADAFQVYRGLNIGTNKPLSPEKYHMVNIRDPHEGFGVGEFVMRTAGILTKAHSEGKNVVIVGGTGFYIRALLEKYDNLFPEPDKVVREEIGKLSLGEMLSRLDDLEPNLNVDRLNPVRVQRALERVVSPGVPVPIVYPEFETKKFAISLVTSTIDSRISVRTHELLQAGWISEVRDLVESGVATDSPAFRAIGYSEVVRFLNGELTFEILLEKIVLKTRQYAKRQRAWLRSEPSLNWLLSDGTPASLSRMASEVIEQQENKKYRQ